MLVVSGSSGHCGGGRPLVRHGPGSRGHRPSRGGCGAVPARECFPAPRRAAARGRPTEPAGGLRPEPRRGASGRRGRGRGALREKEGGGGTVR